LMEVSKESLLDDEDKDIDTDRSSESQVYRLIREMAHRTKSKRKTTRRPKRFGRGPGGERDHDIDMDQDESSDDGDEDELSMVEIRSRALGAGYTEAQLMNTIVQYEEMDIWIRVANGSKLRFIDGGSP